MGYDGSLNFDTSIDGSGFNKGLDKLGTMAKGSVVFKAVSSGLDMIAGSMDSAFGRIDTMEQFDRTMTALTSSSDAAAAALETTREAVTGTAYGLDVAAKGVQNLVTSGKGLEDATANVEGLADAVSFYGDGTNATLATVSDAYAKMTASGKAGMEQINRLTDAGIPALRIYADATGQTVEEVQAAMSKGAIGAEEFTQTLTAAFQNGTANFQSVAGAAKDAGASFQGTFDNFSAYVTRGVVAMVQAVDQGLEGANLPGIRDTVKTTGTAIENTLKGIGKAIPPVVKAAKALAPVVLTGAAAFAAWKIITPIATGMAALSKSYNVTKAALIAFELVAKKTTLSQAALNGTMTAGQIVVGGLSGQIGIATVAQGLWNAAMAANPVGAVVAVVAVLAAGIGALTIAVMNSNSELKESRENLKALGEDYDELAQKSQESAKAHEEKVGALEAEAHMAKNLVAEIRGLAEAEKQDAATKAMLRAKIDQLNAVMPELNLSYNEQTGEVNGLNSALEAYIDNLAKAARQEVLRERAVEVAREQYEIEQKRAEVLAEIEKLKADGNATKTDRHTGEEYNSTEMANAILLLKDYDEQLLALGEDMDLVSSQMSESYMAMADSTEEATGQIGADVLALAEKYGIAAETIDATMKATGMSAEEWADAQDAALERVSNSLASATDVATEMYHRIDTTAREDLGELNATIQHNQAALDQWAQNMALVTAKGIDEGLLKKLEEAGAKSPALLNSLVDSIKADDGQWESINESYANGAQAAIDAIETQFGLADLSTAGADLVQNSADGMEGSTAMQEAAQSVMQQTKTAMDNAVQTLNFASIGANMIKSLAAGIRGAAVEAAAAARDAIRAVHAAAKAADEQHSPSKWWGRFAENDMKSLGDSARKNQGFAVAGYEGAIEAIHNSAKSLNFGERMAAAMAHNQSNMALAYAAPVPATVVAGSAAAGDTYYQTTIIAPDAQSPADFTREMEDLEARRQRKLP